MTTTLLLIRHGETDANVQRRYIGRTDVPLNATGLAQAAELRAAFSEHRIAAIYHSPYQRTLATAAQLGEELRADERLAELHFGAWEALTYDEISERDHLYSWYDDPWHFAPPGGETLQQLDLRLSSWLHDILARHPEQTVAAVSHGGPLRWLLAKYAHRDTTLFHTLRLPPGGHAILKLSEGDLR
ncbi:alpha-ribazole phosphatase/probable phosphoglycerate mutase [Tumebacillus sp. BK434]|nr:alpha-ribazole phosphatase/probable phosphoglycerate mutase [Tumebacillus sp. BK434]